MLNQTGSTPNNYLFTGEQYDSNLGNYYLRARYYNQQVGRFTQQDTYMGRNQDPVTLHKYLYANVDPVNVIDPTGNFGMGSVMSAVNIMSTLVTTAQTVQSVFNVATGKEEMPTARQIGTTIVVAMLGGAAAKVIIKKLSKMADKNSDKVNLANAERTFHILQGEGKGRGGHKLSFRTLFNGKSKFPAHWSADRIMHAVSDVATNPKIKWKQQTGSNGSMYTKAGDPAKFVVEGVSDGIKVRVIVEPAGRGIVTAFPIK